MSYPAIVTAAGGSSRCPEGKLTKPYRGRPLLGWLLERLSAHPRVSSLLVVTGNFREEVEAVAGAYPSTQTVHNPDWSQGLSTSLRAGLRALPAGRGFLVALGDTPLFSQATLGLVLPQDSSEALVRVPTLSGRPGHPVFFPEWARPELGNLRGDQGARPLMEGWGTRVLQIEVDDPGILQDFDRPEDFASVPLEVLR